MNVGLRLCTGLVVAVLVIASCSSSGSSSEPSAECQAACEHLRASCGRTGSVDDCAKDCDTEPWPAPYIECKTLTCEGDGVCEKWGTSPCYKACAHTRLVCERGSGTIEECALDCQTEPWTPGYIECRTQTCEGDSVCEAWGR